MKTEEFMIRVLRLPALVLQGTFLGTIRVIYRWASNDFHPLSICALVEFSGCIVATVFSVWVVSRFTKDSYVIAVTMVAFGGIAGPQITLSLFKLFW